MQTDANPVRYRVWAGRQADGLSDTCIGLVVRRDGQAGG